MTEGDGTGRAQAAIEIKHPGGAGAESTEHLFREELFSDGNVWVGVTNAAPAESGWHHHGDMDTYVYILEGRGVVEYGPGGKQVDDVTPGSVIRIGRGVVHRDINLGPDNLVGFLVRVGQGPNVVNVAGPDPEE
jgi:mannose-6-phosphate isomerase-like protein (cupin superfamily)